MQHILGKVLDKVVGTNAMQCNAMGIPYFTLWDNVTFGQGFRQVFGR